MNSAHQRTLLVSLSSLTVVCDASISLALASSGWYGMSLKVELVMMMIR